MKFQISVIDDLANSGTPFKALSTGEFIEEQIFNWTYTDEQRAKQNYSQKYPAYRATLLYFYSSCTQFTLTLPKNVCTSCYITCRRFRDFYGETMGKYGQFYGQLLTTNNFAKLFVCQLIVVAYRATLLYYLTPTNECLADSVECSSARCFETI